MKKVTHIGLLSGGHSSAITCIEMVRKFGKENCLLLNHDITVRVEDPDIKRFKKEVAEYLEMDITYVNMDGWENKDPLDVCIEIGGFKFQDNNVMCTTKLKTEPFKKFLKSNFPTRVGQIRDDVNFYYGFSSEERTRITRRVGIMAAMGYRTSYPLASWSLSERTIFNIEEVGINRPITYKKYRHANCRGCLKAGQQSWYIVYCEDYEYFQKGIRAEEVIGYSILKDNYLKDLEPKFARMKASGIVPTEAVGWQTFWARVNRILKDGYYSLPCECGT